MSGPVDINLDYTPSPTVEPTSNPIINFKIDKEYSGNIEIVDDPLITWWKDNGVYFIGIAMILSMLFLLFCLWWFIRQTKSSKHKLNEDSETHGGHDSHSHNSIQYNPDHYNNELISFKHGHNNQFYEN